ncbi:hypothetical protein NOVO_01680 [Rickettsiales bacterium Ac37b]|nr:hypothetical protein NOVO_01680 [Rickettsiales bacterium Ac37b]
MLTTIQENNELNIPKNENLNIHKPPHLIFLNEKEFCEITGQKISTARSNRIKGIGCNFYKIGGLVRYKLSEIIEYLESCKCSSTTKKIELSPKKSSNIIKK